MGQTLAWYHIGKDWDDWDSFGWGGSKTIKIISGNRRDWRTPNDCVVIRRLVLSSRWLQITEEEVEQDTDQHNCHHTHALTRCHSFATHKNATCLHTGHCQAPSPCRIIVQALLVCFSTIGLEVAREWKFGKFALVALVEQRNKELTSLATADQGAQNWSWNLNQIWILWDVMD